MCIYYYYKINCIHTTRRCIKERAHRIRSMQFNRIPNMANTVKMTALTAHLNRSVFGCLSMYFGVRLGSKFYKSKNNGMNRRLEN